VQGVLALTLVVSDALNFLLDLATSLSLIPYFLAAAYALKIGLTGEAYDGVDRRTRRKESIIAGIATAYTLFLFEAAGLKFLILCTIILAPMTLLYIKARSENERRIFSPSELALFLIILASAVVGLVGLWSGSITI
jgi:arginine:ornithine antiporter/lysine permease